MMRTMGGAVAVLAVLGMAAPAMADDRRPRRHHHRDKDKVDAGDIAVGALILGGILALSSKKKSSPPVAEAAYVPPAPPEPIPAALDEDGAAEACAEAAEAEGSRLARVVRVDRVSAVDPTGDAWFVKGMLVLRDSYRETGAPRLRGFRCAIAATGVPRVTFDGDAVAAF